MVRLKGTTTNSADGNVTEIVWELSIEDSGRIEGRSICSAGSNYNPAMEGTLTGMIHGDRVTLGEIFPEYFGGAFVYAGVISGNTISGTYFWTENRAEGSFSLDIS